MASNKYYLGDLITQRREKNPGGDLPIRGVSKDGLQPPKQIDADTSIYNLYYRNDFVYNPARMELGSIAFNDEYDRAICSSLYEVFYVHRTDLVIPEYLALFVKHPEFARYCNYIGNGSAREYCRFDNISGIPIYLPPISEQRKIVHDYQIFTDRIELLRKMNENLVSQCDAVYRNLVLEQPLNGKFNEIADVSSGKRPENMNKGDIPLLGAGGVMDYIEEYNYSKPSLIIGRVGTHGVVQRCNKFWASDNTLVISPKYYEYVFHVLRNIDYAALNRGSTQPLITQGDINAIDIYIPEKNIIDDFENKCSIIMSLYSRHQDEINCLCRIQALLISQMSKER